MISPELTETPPELTRTAIYPMRTQRRPVRVVYAVAPDVLACAALTDAYRALVCAGAGLAIQLAVGGSAVLAGPVGDGAGDTAVAAVSGHSHSLG